MDSPHPSRSSNLGLRGWDGEEQVHSKHAPHLDPLLLLSPFFSSPLAYCCCGGGSREGKGCSGEGERCQGEKLEQERRDGVWGGGWGARSPQGYEEEGLDLGQEVVWLDGSQPNLVWTSIKAFFFSSKYFGITFSPPLRNSSPNSIIPRPCYCTQFNLGINVAHHL